MSKDPIKEASKLLSFIESLPSESKKVVDYFMRNISVGDLRAVLDLKKLGIKDPEAEIDKLISLGIIEKGVDCYNLAYPLRQYVFSKKK